MKTCRIKPMVNQVEFHPLLVQQGLLDFCKKHGAAPAQVLLRWALHKGALVVPKSCNPKRIAENSEIFAFSLTAAEVSAIDKLHTGTRLAWKGLDPDSVD